jgi:hypothetical protein
MLCVNPRKILSFTVPHGVTQVKFYSSDGIEKAFDVTPGSLLELFTCTGGGCGGSSDYGSGGSSGSSTVTIKWPDDAGGNSK